MDPARKRFLLGAGLIALLTFAAYIPALRGDFIWDDDQYVTLNPTLTSLEGLKRMWTQLDATPQYYPVVFTTFWIERHLWGLNPIGYHVINVLLHVGSAILLWRVLLRLRIPGAYLAALVFALHPVHVESIAWITERKNALSGLLYFCSLACFLRFSELPNTGAPQRPAWKWYAAALLFFYGALLSKSVTASLPAAILLLLWWKRDRLTWAEVWPLVPFFAVGLAVGLTTAWLERHHVGAAKVEWGLTPVDRVLIAGRAVWFYLGKLLWPHPLIFTYSRWRIDSSAAWQYIFPIAAVIVVAALWVLRNRLGKGPLVAALFFGGTLLPALGFFDVFPMIFSYVADHFQYLASIGPIVLVCAILAGRLRLHSSAARVAGAALVVAPLGVLTWRQGHIYRDLETLWRETLRRNDESWMGHNNLGVLFNEAGRVDEASGHFERAIEINPDNPAAYVGLVDSRVRQGRLDEAAAFLAKALELDPSLAGTHFWMGVVADRKNQFDEALRHYRRALELKPDLADAHNNIAVILEHRGELDAALAHYQKALEGFTAPQKQSRKALIHYNLAALLESRGQIDEALEHYRRAVVLKPEYGEAHLNLANLLFARRQNTAAARHYEQAVLRLPSNPQARYNYGVALSNLNRLDEAAQQFAEALRIKPDYIEARFGLARLAEVRGRLDEALTAYEAIIKDYPDHAAAMARIAALRIGQATEGQRTTSHPAAQSK